MEEKKKNQVKVRRFEIFLSIIDIKRQTRKAYEDLGF